jgi:four helix bundle protein
VRRDNTTGAVSVRGRVQQDTTVVRVEAIPPFADWEAGVDPEQRADPVWRMKMYRLALYAFDASWPDATLLARNAATRGVAGQLYRAIGSIAAGISEGYSRRSGPDRARFFEYSLGSDRESIVWYRAASPVTGPTLVRKRVSVLVEIRRLLLSTIPRERQRRLGRGGM